MLSTRVTGTRIQRESLPNITFNGKSFDVPYILDRSFATGVRMPREFGHVDLLHVARRRWKRVLPNCKLQTLERYISKRIRGGDIPGAEIPQAYHDFVRTGDARKIKPILYHNALDLITMGEVLLFLMEGKDLWT